MPLKCVQPLQPYALSLRSQHFTVSGLVQFSLSIPSVPTGLKILSVAAHIAQSFHLQSLSNPNKSARPPIQRRLLFRLDGSISGCASPLTRSTTSSENPCQLSSIPSDCPPLRPSSADPTGRPQRRVPEFPVIVRQGDAFQISHLARMPNDDIIRPSTHSSTTSVISVTHEIEFEIRFDRLDGSLQVIDKTLAWRVSRPITITSVCIYLCARPILALNEQIFRQCCCMLESLLLPSYSAKDPLDPCGSPDDVLANVAKMARVQRDGSKCRLRCLCGATLECLVKEQGGAFTQAPGVNGIDGLPPAVKPFNG